MTHVTGAPKFLGSQNPAAPAVKRVPQRPSGNASSPRTAFADASAARARGPHFRARSGQLGAMDLIKIEKVIVDASVAGDWR